MYSTYILQSKKHHRYYTGSCQDMEVRVMKHNSGQVRATKSGIPWIVVHAESFQTRVDAVNRERQIKSYKGGNAFKRLIKK